jgi:hypothetical protein
MSRQFGNRLSNWNLQIESITRIKIESNSQLKKENVKENKKIKFFYLFIFFGLACSSMITTYNAINDYLKYDVVSQTRIISDQPSLFPKITVCSTVTFPTKKASDLIVEIVKKVFDQDFNDFNNLTETLTPQDFSTYLGIANIMTVNEVILIITVNTHLEAHPFLKL